MSTLSPRRALVALATLVALVALTGAPASADPPYTFGFTAGDIVVPSLGAAPDIEFTVGEQPPDDPCDAWTPPEIEVAMTPAGGGAWTTTIVPGLIGKTVVTDPSATPPVVYQVDLGIADPAVVIGADNSGTLVPDPPGHDFTQNVWLTVDVYQIDDVPECEKDDLACSLLIVFDAAYSSSLTGEYSGALPPTNPATVTGLSGTGLVVVNGACDAGIAGSFDGTSATLTDGELVFVP